MQIPQYLNFVQGIYILRNKHFYQHKIFNLRIKRFSAVTEINSPNQKRLKYSTVLFMKLWPVAAAGI